jgi:hypothetical protein
MVVMGWMEGLDLHVALRLPTIGFAKRPELCIACFLICRVWTRWPGDLDFAHLLLAGPSVWFHSVIVTY